MKAKRIVVALLAFLMLSGVTMTALGAVWMPSLPTDTVTLAITNTTAWTFPWMVTLTGTGSGFNVDLSGSTEYTGWCVDTEHGIDRTQTYPVNLYSSYDLSSLPAAIASVDWDLINFVLNNKDAGTADDIQAVLWYIVSGDWLTDAAWGYTHTATADAILADAMANGAGYEPGEGDILAVICLPVGSEEERAQMLIIELSVPTIPRGGGKVTGGGQCVVGDHKEIPSASFGFNAMWFSRDAKPKGEINYVDHTTGQHVHVHLLDYLLVWEDLPGNKPHPMMKAKFWGTDVYSGKLVEVYVEDNGEPGKNDKFLIFLGGEYLGGSGDFYGSTQIDDTILAGNIQIHKPPK